MLPVDHPDCLKLHHQSQMLEKTTAIQRQMAELAEASEEDFNNLRDALNRAAILSVEGAKAEYLGYLAHCFLILFNHTKKEVDLNRARGVVALLEPMNFLIAGKTCARLGAVSRKLDDLLLAIRLAELIKSHTEREEIYAEVEQAISLDMNHTARVAIAYNLAPEIRDPNQRKNFLARFSRLSNRAPRRG